MANNCFYDMRVKGTRNNVHTFYNRMCGQDGDNYIGRIFSAYVIDNDIFQGDDNDIIVASIEGDCAWSVVSAMIDGYSYSHLIEATKELELVVEVYSSEAGCEFQEYYFINKGDIEEYEVVDYEEIWVEDMTYDEIQDKLVELGNGYKYNDEIHCIVSGGFEEWNFELNNN